MPECIGDGCECCGTAVLRNYKLLSCDTRSRLFGNDKGSLELEKCSLKTLRNKKLKNLTIGEACNLNNNKK